MKKVWKLSVKGAKVANDKYYQQVPKEVIVELEADGKPYELTECWVNADAKIIVNG